MANTDFDPDAYLKAPPTTAEPAAFDPDKYLAAPPERAGILKTAGMVGQQLVDAAYYHAPAAVAAAMEGDDPYAARDWKDTLIERSRAKAKQRTEELGKGPTSIPWVGDREDIAQLGPSFGASVPASVAGLVTGLGAGAATALTPAAPAAPYTGLAAGTAAAGALAYRGSTNQFVRDLRDSVDAERAKSGKKPISDEEFNAKRTELAPLIKEYGLWEAIPEAAGQALGLKIVTAPVKHGIGKVFGDNVVKRFATKAAALYGEELATETVTQQGQHNVEIEAGTKPGENRRSWTSPSDLAESFKEVAPVTTLQTTLMGAGMKAGQMAHRIATRDSTQAQDPNQQLLSVMDRIDRGEAVPATEDTLDYQGLDAAGRAMARADVERLVSAKANKSADELRGILGEPPDEPAPAPVEAAPVEDQRSILGEERQEESRPDSEYYVNEAMRNLRATSRTANGVLDTTSTPGKEDSLTGVSASHAATLAKENFEGVIRGLHDRLDELPQDGPTMAALIDGIAESVNEGIVKPGEIMRTRDTKIPAQTAAMDLPAAHEQFSEEMAARLADPNADPVETAAWIEWRSNMIDHFWTDGVGKTSKALAAIPLMRAGLPLPNYPSTREFYSYSPKERVDPNGGGEAYLGPAWERFNAFYHTLVDKPEAQQRADLKAMVADPNVSVQALAKQPLVQRAIEENRRAVQTGSTDDFRDPEWRDRRIYDFGGESVQGWNEAVTKLTAGAEAFSTAEPVENGRHAVIVLGPPAAGKSTVSEPLARAYRAALVDADEAKKVIPEYRNGLGTNAVHEESSHLAADVLASLVLRGANLILPKVGHNYESIKGLVDRLKKRGYSVDIAHVAATPEISGRRNINRFLETGRLVDPEYITEVGDKPRDTAYMLKGEANDFIDANTSQGFEIVEGSGPLADALRARRDTGQGHERGPGSVGSQREGIGQELVGDLVDGLRPHRVTDADGRSVEVAPIIVEAGSLRTSRDYGYDPELQPRDRDRAASDAQIREITNKLDPERLGYSSEADRGSPIIGSDGMVESGNGRVIALRNVYDKNGQQAQAYRDWLSRQGVNVGAYQNPILVRQRLTPLTPKERQAFTLAANRPATLAMSAPERAVSDARHIDAKMLGLIKNTDDIGSIANRAFFRRFLSMLPKSEHGVLADARGHLSAEGLTRARNAILAKAYGGTAILARIAESTNDEVKSISNALLAAAPAWAKMRADVEAGHVRADIDATADLVRAVDLTAEIRSRGEKLETFLDQRDAFDALPGEVENFMRIFYDPTGRRAASAQRIADTIRFVADEGSKVSAEKGLGLDLIPVSVQDIQRVAIEREWEDVEQQASKPGDGVGDGSRGPQGGGQVRGPWLGAGREDAAQRLDAGDPVEEAIRAQQPTLDDLRALGVKPKVEKTKAGDQFVFPGGERISTAELLRRRSAAPLRPRAEQRPADMGLFGEVSPQGDLLQNREQTPTIGETRETGDGRPGIQPAAPAVPGRTQARRLAKAPVKRTPELPLFGWQPSERPVRQPDDGVRPESGSEGPAVHAEGPSVTKPPTRGQRNRPGRTDSPAVKGRVEAEKKIAERSRSNYRITPEDAIGVGGAKAKVRGNIEAIRTLKVIQDENRFATPEEKAVLVKYVGWGAFAQELFDSDNPRSPHRETWKVERETLRALVSDEEYRAARASTENAHFTSPDVIRGMWDAMEHLGFKGGQAIEPAAGVGHFIGLIPDKFASKTAWTATELDQLTGGIAKTLYGGTDVGIQGFETLKRPSNYYDLAISNVPFSEVHISEKPYGSFPVHDFFFVKSLDKVRPGGVVSFITSRYTMDRVDPETRRLLGQTADLVGAIRLPGGRKGAFAGNAGTEVTTDIIFLRKKVPGEPAFPGAAWTELKEIKTKDGPVKVNEYFADRPEMMLGEMRLQGTMYRADEPILVGTAEGLQERIAEAARKMPEGALLPMESPAPPPITGDEIGAGIKDGSFFLQNGKLYQRRQGQGFEHPLGPEDHDRVTRLIGMRGIINDLLETQLSAGDNSREQAEHIRGKLRAAYDAFVDKYGPINKEDRTVTNRLDKEGEPIVTVRMPNFHPFRKDPDAWKVGAIESYDSESGKAKRNAIQTKDVIDPVREREINGPADALSASLNDTAGVDLDYIAQSLNLDSHDAAIQALGDLVYQNPDGRKFETTDQYLSGDVVKKLEDARALAQQDPSYLRNVAALEKVQPTPLTGTDITAQFGAPWIPAEVYQDFLSEIGIRNPRVARVPITGEWRFDYVNATRDAQTKYGTDRVEVGKIVNAALNNKMVTVYDRGKEKDVVNDKATQEARVKTELLKEAFTGDMEHGIDGWVFGEPDRAALLEGIYNRTYNNLAQRKFDGSHLSLPGMNPDFTTRKHRLDAIWRIIQSGNTLLAHVVGSGKAQPLTAKVLTARGWKRMGDVRVGDQVIAGDGLPTKVTGVFPQGEKDIFSVTFSDGAVTECCDEHLWFTHTYRERGYAQRARRAGRAWDCGLGKVRPLSEIRTTLVSDHLGAKNHSIPMVGSVRFEPRQTGLDPYLVGFLIGDGCLTMRRVQFSTADNFILSKLSGLIPEDCELVHIGQYDYAIAYRGKVARAVGERGSVPSHPVKNALINLGLFGKYANEKRVPEIYLHNDEETRIGVLRGLMDSDGTVDKRGVDVSFCTTSVGLADDVVELVRSLGGVAKSHFRPHHAFYNVQIAMPAHLNPFCLPRKADRVRPKSKYAPTRYIVNVKPVGKKAAQCIMIDHPSHLYVTDDYIVTHNTATMIGAGMEEKRLGLINKPAYVIPNHMLEQFSREFIETYPNAKILVAQKDEMTREHRKEFLAKVAANDWDGVIITHDAFGRINMGQDFRRSFIQDQLDELERAMKSEVAESKDKKSPTVKNLEKAKKKLEERLNNLMNEERKDEGTSFEESGIDRLYVDEAHKFKNLQFITRLSNISGLAQGNSQRAEDLFLKIRYLEQKRPGRSAVFATGTPVSNTMAELWTMMRYLELDKLKERGLDSFDSWASTFGRVVSNMELSPDGRTFKEKSSFSKFVNIPELVALYSEIADTKTADMLNLPRPEVKTRSGAPGIEIVEASPSAQEEAHIEELVKLAESLKGKRPEKGEPNMLSVVTAGRKVATDGRLISSDFDFNPQGKIAKAVDNITRIYEQGNKDPAAPNKVQMVFLDMGVPQTRSAKKPKAVEGEISVGPTPQDRINLYADLKERLVAKGIPAREIAAIHDAGDDAKKAKLFAKVRSGEIRVIMGSSEKMGVGTNVQDRLIAMHHLDAPWKPADVEQRDGRIVRQGNLNKTVQIYRYVTKKSFDAFMWQKLDTKSKFIGQVLSGAKGSRHAEDIDNPLPEAAEMKAAASGDPRIMEHAELDRIVRGLTAQRRAHESTKARANSEVGQAKSRIEMYEKALPNAREDAGTVQDIAGDKFTVDLGDAGTITNRAEAGKAILDRISGLDPNLYRTAKVLTIGRLSGFTMNLELRGAWDGTGVMLRATPSLKGKAGYSASNDSVINEHTDAAGLIRRYENILANIRTNPDRLSRELANEKESLGKLQRTQAGVWPKETEYREALKKLDDLSKSMKAPEHPDVVESATEKAQAPEERKEYLTVDGKPAWMVLVDPIDNAILHSVSYKKAADANFHHSLYLDRPLARMVNDGEAIMVWGDAKGIYAMERMPRAMRAAVMKLYDPAIKARTGWESVEGDDMGPQPGERAVRLGRITEAHVSDEYSAAEQKIADAVTEIGQRMAPQANVVGTKALRMHGSPIWGAFVNNSAFPHLIAWSLEHGSVDRIAGTVRHEIIHHLREAGLIRPDEWAALAESAVKDDWIGKHNIEDRYQGLSRDHKIEEAIAEQFSHWRTNREVIKTFKDPVQRLIRDAFNRIDLLLRRVAAAARKFMGKDATAADIFTRIETGEIGRRDMAKVKDVDLDAIWKSLQDEAAQAARQIETPAFKRWFGDSKVVDEGGKPLVVYHGTQSDFTAFSPDAEPNTYETDRGKFFFTTNRASAEGYAKDTGNEPVPGQKPRVIEAYVSLKKPMVIENVDHPAKDWDRWGDLYSTDAKRAGNDGIIIQNNDGSDKLVVAFHPTQIKSATGNRGTFDPNDPDVRAQTPGKEARERRQAAGVPANTIWQRVVQSSDNLRAKADAYADSIGVNEVIRGLQMNLAPMSARDATAESRLIPKEFANARRQSRHDWNNADKFLQDNFSHERRRAMWEAADEQSVAEQQGLPTAGIGLDRLSPDERAVVQMLQTRGQRNFDEARKLKMVEAAGLPSYVPRMLVKMTDNKAEVGAGDGSEIVKDIRTLALANARLEDAIATRKLINAIEDIGIRSGSPTVIGGGGPTNRIGADGLAMHALDQMGQGISTTTPQLRHRKHLTAAETEAAANLVQAPDTDAPKWFTLNNPAFMRTEPRIRVNETTGKVEVVKDKDGNTIFDRRPIQIRSDFEGPLRAVLEKGWDNNKLYQALMSLKGKAMSIIMMSPLIHNQVEWGRALPAAPGKVLTFQIYLEGNRVAHDPAQMRQAITGGTAPIGGHGFMQDLTSIAEAPTVRPGRGWAAKGAGYAAEATGHITRLFNPRSGADEVRRAVDWLGNHWHNTLLWDRIRDLQMGLWSHINQKLLAKGYNPYAANVAASHFANRYAGALPIEAMSGGARAIANLLLFSRSFTLGNLGAYKDAALGLPRDAQAMIQHHAGWDELQKIQSFVRRKSMAMLAIDAGMYYVTLSALQSAFNTAGVVPSVATFGGMIAGGALGGKAGKYGRLAVTIGGGAAAFGLAAVLGASPGTKKLEDELMGYWDRFTELMHKIGEHPFATVANPVDMLESLSSTSENEPGKKGRILVGYQPDGSAIYARLAVGKVTEELIGWGASPNEMLHNKLSTFARPTWQLLANDVGFGHKLYNPKADTFGERAKNLFKIVANIVGSQMPIDTVKGAYEWAEGGPGSDVAGLKAIAPFIGTTISKGYPGGPELGVLNDAKERQKYEQNEWMPTIRKMIKNDEVGKAIEKMDELGIAPGLQKYYIATTQNPKARLSKRAMQDFMRTATPEQKKDFEAAQQRSDAANRSMGGAAPARAHGGRVEAQNINHEPTEAQKHAGNYAKDHVHIFGLDLTIENAKGSVRRGVGPDGKAWACALPAHYGYVKKTHGQDDDHVDVYLGPHSTSPHVFVVDQHDLRTGKMDEHKAMLGFGSQKQALACYEKAFSDGKGRARIGAVTTMTVPQFKEWLATESEKRTHDSVDYVETSAGKDHCAICKHFIPGNPPACTGVKSPISPMGYCKRFKAS